MNPNIKRRSIILVSIVSLLTLSLLFATAQCKDTLQWSENFESYGVDTFPSAGGWTLSASGAGISDQRISSDESSSGQKSLRLLGAGTAAIAARPVTVVSDIIGFEAEVWVNAMGGTSQTAASVWFAIAVSTVIAGVDFTDTGKIEVVGDTDLIVQDYEVRSWYKIRLEIDCANGRFSVWVNGQQKANDVAPHSQASLASSIDTFAAQSSAAHQIVYIDDVRVFDVAPDPAIPIWSTWTVWTTVVLGITTAVLAFTTVYYRKKLGNAKKPQIQSSRESTGSPTQITCSSCGAKLPSDSKFCGKCGTAQD